MLEDSNLQASGFFDLQEWDQVEVSARKLLELDKLKPEDEFNGNLLLGQSLYRQEKWNDCIEFLEFANSRNSIQSFHFSCL